VLQLLRSRPTAARPRPHNAEGHRDFHYRFAFLVLDNDSTDVSLMDQFLDPANELFAIYTEFFGAKSFLDHFLPPLNKLDISNIPDL
jgi:hypothetical protein